jgi:hypothetical protein
MQWPGQFIGLLLNCLNCSSYRKIKLTDKNISNMRKYLIDEMRKKYSRRKELLKSIE